MSRKIVGVTVGTPISPEMIRRKLKPVQSINGVVPDENGKVTLSGLNGEAGNSIFYSSEEPDMNPDGVYEITPTAISSTRFPKLYDLIISPSWKMWQALGQVDTSAVRVTLIGSIKPQKGVDYWTAGDKAEMVSYVIDNLPIYNGEVVEV